MSANEGSKDERYTDESMQSKGQGGGLGRNEYLFLNKVCLKMTVTKDSCGCFLIYPKRCSLRQYST